MAAGTFLLQVLHDLAGAGLVRSVNAEVSGKTSVTFAAANRYIKGTPFPRKEREKAEAEPTEEAEEEDLCDFEVQRQQNIARNQELLRQLGLA